MYRQDDEREENLGVYDGMRRNAEVNEVTEKFHASRGHGFAAERANHLYDNGIFGNRSQMVGDDNAKDGADRIVDGISIQSKYCSSGSKCVRECFRDGKFRYYNADRSPMEIEVPADFYDDAVKAMADRIAKGEVEGVRDPRQAKEIIRKGHFTYVQACNIAKAGTIEGLSYDAVTGTIAAMPGASVSAAVTFWNACNNGFDIEEAAARAAGSLIKTFGRNVVSGMIVGQLTRAGANAALRPATDAVVRMAGSKAASVFATLARGGTPLYGGAALNYVSKFLRTNVVTGTVTTLVLSAGDISNIFRGRISTGQLLKNVVNTGAGVAGGAVGGWGGAAAGAAAGSVVPILGTAAGAFVGGVLGMLAGSSAGTAGSRLITDALIEDDAKKILAVVESVFQQKAQDYLLSRAEADRVASGLQGILTLDFLKDMYAQGEYRAQAERLMEGLIAGVIRGRKRMASPDSAMYARGFEKLCQEAERGEDNGKGNEDMAFWDSLFNTGSKKKHMTSDETMDMAYGMVTEAVSQNKIGKAEAAKQMGILSGLLYTLKPFEMMAQGGDHDEMMKKLKAYSEEMEEQVAKMEAAEKRKMMGGEEEPSMHGMTETEMYFLKKFIGS